MNEQNLCSIRVALADDEQLFLDGMKSVLSMYEGIEIVQTASDGNELLAYLKSGIELPDVVILDLRMTPLDGVETTKVIKDLYPELKIVILSSYYNDAFIGLMIELGANAFLAKNTSPNEMVGAIRAVYEKDVYYTDDILRIIRKRMISKSRNKRPGFSSVDELTKRELEILELICYQMTTSEIAEKLFISKRTAEGHRNNLLLKTGARNTAGLVTYAMIHNLIDMHKLSAEYTLQQEKFHGSV